MILGRNLQNVVPGLTLTVLILSLLPGCRSNVIVLDQRPTWVVEAEQRLAGDPVFNLDETSTRDTRPLWDSQAMNSPQKPKEISTSRTRPSIQETANTLARPKRARPAPVQPPGIIWGETKISVQVED